MDGLAHNSVQIFMGYLLGGLLWNLLQRSWECMRPLKRNVNFFAPQRKKKKNQQWLRQPELCFPTIPNQCVWIDNVVSPRIWWGMSFSSELWWGVIHWDMSLEYERRNKGSKVSSMAFIQSFLDWDILWLSFPPPAPTSLLMIWSVLWLFASVRSDPSARSAAVSANGMWWNQSWTVTDDTVQVCEGGRRGRVWIYIYIWM